MPPNDNPKNIRIATRGSALALAQARSVLEACRMKFPALEFELKIFKTSGDKLQTASMSKESGLLPKGLFTKELESALLKGRADMAVHSLKDLPTELPAGLKLGGVGGRREDVRDVLIYRDARLVKKTQSGRCFASGLSLEKLPANAVVATSSTRRAAQIRAVRPDIKIVPIRGNVVTRMEKLLKQPEIDATILAMAGLTRLKMGIEPEGKLTGDGVPSGLLAQIFGPEQMLPCVGQAIIGIEIREDDERLQKICAGINDSMTFQCGVAERALLKAMGGGCQAPLGAYAREGAEGMICLEAVSFLSGKVKRASGMRPAEQALELGVEVASRIR